MAVACIGGRQFSSAKCATLGSHLRGAVEALNAFVQACESTPCSTPNQGFPQTRLDDALKLHGAMLDDADLHKLISELQCLPRFDSLYLKKRADLQEFGIQAAPCNFDARA